MPSAATSTAQIDAIAGTIQRLAVLLEAGVVPQNAWVYLAEPADGGTGPPGAATETTARRRRVAPPRRDPGARHREVVRLIARAVNLGVSSDQAIDAACRASDARSARAWRSVAAVWAVASESGAPIALCLREVATALREIGDNQRAIAVALAAPVATARLMTVLPLAALGFGAILGFDTLHTLTATPPGIICLLAGAGLLLLSRIWNGRLVRSATPKATVTGLSLELMAVAMEGGASVARARRLTQTALETYDLLEPRGLQLASSVVDLATRAGVPAAELLRSEGHQARREAFAVSQKVSAALSVKLMLPLGLCVLPAFMVLGVAPLLLSVISSTFGSW
ncbi:type II secretion system F family protein [Subtercola boreus]|uniref:Type II secretion system protein GspF domain-containing protein n=1 Tax=Subtercola boreus TaxID=120213 RepID=A0A3E0WFU4_9MICO|nr:type II secretion system F family protein [Subtercola boreus]RFA22566.1 hypothetical protein B7R24_02785 [Subtercola boreus]RFA22922.1 hypothetical protein B7R23_02780 [Subtercola boreus]RFA28673.1 hypothetical protein B7R25_02795 [Subtercola boreus]